RPWDWLPTRDLLLSPRPDVRLDGLCPVAVRQGFPIHHVTATGTQLAFRQRPEGPSMQLARDHRTADRPRRIANARPAIPGGQPRSWIPPHGGVDWRAVGAGCRCRRGAMRLMTTRRAATRRTYPRSQR